MQNYTIDIQSPHGPLVLYVAQGDAQSRIFQITVTDGGAAYTFPEGAAFSVRYGAQGMPSGWYDTITEVGGSTRPAVSAASNVLTVEVASQATGKAGANALNVVVNTADGYQLASWPFLLIVTPVPGSSDADASVYYDLLSQQVAQVLASAQAAAASATLAESWAVGGTGSREGEDTNNAKYYCEQAQSVTQGQLGWYATPQDLQAAHPTGQNGQWAIIGSTDTIWTWDSDTSAWVNSGAQVDLSNYYTKDQANAAFATAAQGTKADTAVQSINGKTGTAVTLAPQDVGGVSTYTCTTSGTVHALAGTGNNIKFVADAAYATGDTITVNGTTVTAQTQDGSALDAGAWASGATVVCWLDGVKLTVGAGVGSNAKSGFLTGQWIFALGRLGYGGANVNDSAQDWVNYDDDLSKTVYAALYAVVGDNLSVGAASGMFNCKKMADRFPVISGSSYAPLSQGGEATHTLTIDEMPSHTHLEQYENPGSAYYKYVTGTTGNRDPNSVATNVPTLPAGGGAAHNNMPPYVGMYVHIHA